MSNTRMLDQVSPDTTFINYCSGNGVNNNNNVRITSNSGNHYSYSNTNVLNEYCIGASMCGRAESNDFDEYLAEEGLDELPYIDFDILQDSTDIIDKNYQQDLFSDTSSRSSYNSIGNCSNSTVSYNDNSHNISALKGSRRLTSTGISSLPASSPYSGDYGFEIKVEKQSKDSKAGLYTFSEGDKKLYTRPFVSCPVVYRTRGSLPSGSILRILPVYVRPEHVQEVVRRCPNHQIAQEPDENLRDSVEHLMLAESERAMYERDEDSGRLSIVLNHETGLTQSDSWYHATLKFMCYSSCVGGLNRRPLQLIFTLEQGGRVLGRQSIEVRICACPGRDRRGAEKQRAGCDLTRPPPVQNETKSLMKSSARRVLRFDEKVIPRKEIKLEKTDCDYSVDNSINNNNNSNVGSNSIDNNNVFLLSVRGRKSFELLVRLRDCLELVQFLPRQQLQYYSTMQQNKRRQICSK